MARSSKKRTHEKLNTTSAYRSGRIRPEEYGAQIGWWSFYRYGKARKKRVINLGPVVLGTETYLLGAAVGESAVFLGLNGRLWKITGKKSTIGFDIVAPKTTDSSALKIWADTVAQRIVDELSPSLEVSVNREGSIRYQNMIKALVDKRIDEAIYLGYNKTYSYYAKCINHRWDIHQLLNPRYPTMKHAIYVALVLALPARQAAKLMAGAALYEYKSPYITEESALMIYQQAVSLLSKLCPEWWNNGALTRWEYIGSLDMILSRQYANTIINAKNLDVDLETAAGMVREETLGSNHRLRRGWPSEE
tara:strand:- start:4052 stop:4969 length:918 start_codon:yes stop_codon:yes gene_type:complete